MNYSNVKVGHIYYVQFNPVRPSEFDDWHLALVLRKNSDHRTIVVVPLTSSSKGLGKGKIELGILKCLPLHLQSKATYAVVNQVRTVNCSRFSPVFSGGIPVDIEVDTGPLAYSLQSIIEETMYNIDDHLKNDVFRKIFHNSSIKLINNLLYDLLKEQNSTADGAVIARIAQEILDILSLVPYEMILLAVDDKVKSLLSTLYSRSSSDSHSNPP